MAISHQPVFVQTPKIGPQSFVNADGTTKKTVVTAGVNGTKVVGLTATSTDTAARVCQVWLTRSAVSYLLVAVSVPIGAGSDGVIPNVDLLSLILWPGLPVDGVSPFFFLQSGDTLQVSMAVAVTAAKEIDVTAQFSDF